MECPAFAKISALSAVYACFFAVRVSATRKELVEAWYWIADELEDQLQAEGNLERASFKAFQELKDIAESAFTDPAQWQGAEEYDRAAATLIQRIRESEDRVW